jgi:anti-sigma factor RsiW
MAHDSSLTCEQLIDALDDYLDRSDPISATADGRVPPISREAVEAHLAVCPTCHALVADVRAIRMTARTLGPIAPPADVWRKVRAQVHTEAPPRLTLLERLGFTGGWRNAWQPLGAAAVLVLIVSGLGWVGLRLSSTPPPVQIADGAGGFAEFELAEAQYADAIARLEEAAEAARPQLDALTSATLRSSIDDIDLAIVDAREALAREPADLLSQESLLDALGSKVALLQDTVALGAFEPAEEQNP